MIVFGLAPVLFAYGPIWIRIGVGDSRKRSNRNMASFVVVDMLDGLIGDVVMMKYHAWMFEKGETSMGEIDEDMLKLGAREDLWQSVLTAMALRP